MNRLLAGPFPSRFAGGLAGVLRLAAATLLVLFTYAQANAIPLQIVSIVDHPNATETQVMGISGSSIFGYWRDASDPSNTTINGFVRTGTTWTNVSAPWAVNNGYTIVTALSGSTTVGYYLDNNYKRVGFVFDGSTFSQVLYPDASDTYLTAVAGATVYGNTFEDIAFSLSGTTFTQLDLGFRTRVQAMDGQRYLGYSSDSGISSIIDGQSSIQISYPNTFSTEAFGFDGNTAVGDIHYIDSTYSTYGGFYFDGTNVIPLDSINGYRVRPRGIVGSTVVGSFYSSELGRPVGFVATVPEPSTYAMALAGLACGGFSMWRRRKHQRVGRAFITTASLALVAASFSAAPAHAVTIDLVTVGSPGNANDTTGYGAVGYEYRIGKYEVTIQQYTDFLNAVAATDTYSLYDGNMASNPNIAGISRSGTSGGYSYSVINNGGVSGDRPITYVSWFDAARFANWMQNGQGTGSTETGAYTLVGGQTSGTAPAKNPGATFYIPTENEWYKAAYYKGSGTNAGYWDYATQSDTAPGNTIGSGTNQANYNNNGVFSVTQAGFSGTQNYLTDVGAFTNNESAYGTFDMSGNVFEWNDLTGVAGSSRGLRGGSWLSDAFSLSSSFRNSFDASFENNYLGFRLASPVAVPEPSAWVMGLAGIACGGWGMWRRRKRSPRSRALTAAVSCLALTVLFLTPAHAVTIDWVTVGDPGNDPDPATGDLYGAVDKSYRIGKYDVTIGQYTAFLNAADPNGTNPNGIYNVAMATDLKIAGISYTSGASAGAKYAVINNGGDSSNRPITYVSWFDAARFSNWMTNGQGGGDTETGAYTLNGATTGNAVAVNPGAAFYIPTENEWYKAAYYSPNYGGVGVAGYYAYATQSDSPPYNFIESTANQANYRAGDRFSVTQSSSYDPNQNYLTDVGAFSGSGSFYGTFDQSGNVFQWNDLDGLASSGSSRGLRGGDWNSGDPFLLWSSYGFSFAPSNEYDFLGFRLASPVPVPEPSTYATALAGLACGGFSMFRRRKRA